MFEITFTYHERDEDGKYDINNSKEFTKKITNKKDEDGIPLESVAKLIIFQLSKRNIWVTGVQIFEYVKKEISFRETNNGIVIKNKKFNFADNIIVSEEEEETVAPPTKMVEENNNHVNIQEQVSNVGLHPHEQGRQRRPIDWMLFSPELPHLPEIKQKGYKLTIDKKYPVFEKKTSGLGELFVITDDTGREQLVSDKYFVPGNIQLFADKELGFSENQQKRDGGNLYWGGANIDSNMPDIRR